MCHRSSLGRWKSLVPMEMAILSIMCDFLLALHCLLQLVKQLFIQDRLSDSEMQVDKLISNHEGPGDKLANTRESRDNEATPKAGHQLQLVKRLLVAGEILDKN